MKDKTFELWRKSLWPGVVVLVVSAIRASFLPRSYISLVVFAIALSNMVLFAWREVRRDEKKLEKQTKIYR